MHTYSLKDPVPSRRVTTVKVPIRKKKKKKKKKRKKPKKPTIQIFVKINDQRSKVIKVKLNRWIVNELRSKLRLNKHLIK